MTAKTDAVLNAPFGSVFAPVMAITRWSGDRFDDPSVEPLRPLELHPGAHVLHYASSIFEGLKAHRGPEGQTRLFRLDRHVDRMRRSAELLCLPPPPAELLTAMIAETAAANRNEVPDPPGSLYLRPAMIGTQADVGAAAKPPDQGLLYVVACPVGDYFTGGIRPLRVLVEDEAMRSTPGFGAAKTGANYAAALRTVVEARTAHGADQVLFAPAGDVQETGASNFLLIDDERVVTKPVDGTFLPGVTREAVLILADHLGYTVEERDVSIADVLDWARHGEAALSGTAAVLAGVGTLVYRGVEHRVGSGEVGPNTLRLRKALTDLQIGAAPDTFGWITEV